MRKLFPVLIFLFLTKLINSQTRPVDSLLSLVKVAKEDTNKVKLLIQLSEVCNEEDILVYSAPALELSKKLNYKPGIALALNNFGYVYNNRGQIKRAIDYFLGALKIQEEIGDKRAAAYSINNLAFIYNSQGQIPKAFEYYQKAAGLAKEFNDYRLLAYCLDNIGVIYSNEREYAKALEHHKEALILREKANVNIAEMASSYSHIALIYYYMDSLNTALSYHQKCIDIWTGTNHKDGLASVFNNVSHIYLRKKEYRTAAAYAVKSLNMALEIGSVSSIMNAEGVLYKTDSAMGDFRGALLHHMKHIRFRDSIHNTETKNAAVRKQMEYDFEKKEAVAEAEHKKELENQQEIANEKSRKQAAITWAVAAGLLVVFLFTIYIFRSLKLTRRQKKIIELKNQETEKQKLIIEEKNKDILDSLHYARRIQNSLLPNEKYLDKSLSRLFKN